MASFKKIDGQWRAWVARQGIRKSKVFRTKAEAESWATKVEADILAGKLAPAASMTVAQAIDKYIKTEVPKRRGGHYEKRRLLALIRLCPWLAEKPVAEVTSEDMARWRDERRRAVSDASVVRESSDLRTLWRHCRSWKVMSVDPFHELPMPKKGHARARLTKMEEIKRLLRSMGFKTGKPPKMPQQQVAWAYLIAHHTALRSGEILRLARSNVDLVRRVYRLEVHKTMEEVGVRHVPFTKKAARLLAVLDAAAQKAGRDAYFTISDESRDELFRRVRDRLMIDDLHFHDSRADALTRLSKRYDVMTLARISGHKDIKQLYNTYYRESAESVASRL